MLEIGTLITATFSPLKGARGMLERTKTVIRRAVKIFNKFNREFYRKKNESK